MNIAELHEKLLAAARLNKPDEAAPLAFEKRVMAHIACKPAIDLWAIWNRALWQAAAPCVAVMLVLGGWALVSSRNEPVSETLAADLESAVYAPFESFGETW